MRPPPPGKVKPGRRKQSQKFAGTIIVYENDILRFMENAQTPYPPMTQQKDQFV